LANHQLAVVLWQQVALLPDHVVALEVVLEVVAGVVFPAVVWERQPSEDKDRKNGLLLAREEVLFWHAVLELVLQLALHATLGDSPQNTNSS